MRNTRVPGHGLQREGRAFDLVASTNPWAPDEVRRGPWLQYTGEREGRGACSCGECSPILPSTAARKRWFEDHKATMREAANRG